MSNPHYSDESISSMYGADAMREVQREHERKLASAPKQAKREAIKPMGPAPYVLFDDLDDTVQKDWLVRGLFGAGEASCIFGKPGDGKSVLAEDMALHIAAGRDWHGRQVRHGAVLYIALERKKLVERRAIAFRRKHGVEHLPFAILGGPLDFRDPKTADYIKSVVKQLENDTDLPVVVVVIDTLSRALRGGDENSSKDMGAVVAATGAIQAIGPHVSWLHHIPADGADRLRGHGALLGAMDTTLSVKKGASVRTATVDKANDSEEGESVSFTLESVKVGKDADGNETTAPVVVSAEPVESPKKGPGRKLSDRQRLSLDALDEATIVSGRDAPPGLGLPAGIRVVRREAWQEEIFRRGVINPNHANPRTAFTQLRDALAARKLIGEMNGDVWRV